MKEQKDKVEVIRCRDCKYAELILDQALNRTGMCLCHFGIGSEVPEEGYCNYAEHDA